MIYVNKEHISEDDFVSLLEATRAGLLNSFGKNIPNVLNGNKFEEVVFEEMKRSSVSTVFEGHIEQTGTHSFPDIIARSLYGVEVKMTIGDKWVSTGNSVLETTRIEDVQTVYMLFGKFGKEFDVRYRKYEDCLYDIGVTHSPRYKIDMDLPIGKSIFHKIGTDYNTFRNNKNPISIVKDYYRNQLKEGEDLWWIDNSPEERIVSPIIQLYSSLDKETKDRFIVECLILFPEIFSNSIVKFEKAATYLITNYNAVSSSLRDSFTAGGRVNVLINGTDTNISRLAYNLYSKAKYISEVIQTIPKDKLTYYWQEESNTDVLNVWLRLIKSKSKEDVDIVDIFIAGLAQ